MSLNDELTAIETAVTECEQEIASGKISVDAIVRQIRTVADPNAMIAKAGELTKMLIGKSEQLNILRLKELKHQYPNDSRINNLGNRAAECFLKLNSTGLDISEELVSPELKQGVREQNQKMKEGLNLLVAGLR